MFACCCFFDKPTNKKRFHFKISWLFVQCMLNSMELQTIFGTMTKPTHIICVKQLSKAMSSYCLLTSFYWHTTTKLMKFDGISYGTMQIKLNEMNRINDESKVELNNSSLNVAKQHKKKMVINWTNVASTIVGQSFNKCQPLTMPAANCGGAGDDDKIQRQHKSMSSKRFLIRFGRLFAFFFFSHFIILYSLSAINLYYNYEEPKDQKERGRVDHTRTLN